MPSQRTKSSRRSKKGTLYEDDADAADAVTYENRTRTTRTGRTVPDLVKVSLAVPQRRNTGDPWHIDNQDTSEGYEGDYDIHNTDDHRDDGRPVDSRPRKTQRDYILQFVERVDDILGALLSREAPRALNAPSICTQCHNDCISVWRCRDCSIPSLLCRRCIRHEHQVNPMHRIERWNGAYFRSAELWEVGCYLLISHHSAEFPPLCESLTFQKQLLEELEERKDFEEQALLRVAHPTSESPSYPSRYDNDIFMDDTKEDSEHTQNPDGITDDQFEEYLNQLREDPSNLEGFEDGDDEAEVGDADSDVRFMPAYLSPPTVGNRDPNSTFTGNAPFADGLNNSYVRVVHTNGLHHLAMVSCVCHGSGQLPLDLMACRLLPTSFQQIRTLFSAQLLDYFRLSNLELKSSAYQFYSLLRRVTNPTAPHTVVNLYNEFRRMSRLWRWMKKLKWAGFGGHNGKSALSVGRGELANFCPACPQPGVNLSANWKDDPNRWVYKRVFVADGNFKADHVRSKKPSRDIWLSEGGGMTPDRMEYGEFLKSAIEALTGAPCENTFRAIQNSLLSSKSCDVTGIVGVACARHGCYAPNSLVDLFKGEQQKNVDFALLSALKSTGVDPDQGLAVIYDIICQYIIYLLKRIGHLLPKGLKVDRAIGMFHVHAHKDECFFRYAPTFIPGAACVCGEILESLWADLNHISPAARTATLAHRAELLDDHASDSNHKKALGITKYLCRRHDEAEEKQEQYRVAFVNLTQGADPDAVKLWKQQIEEAESKRLVDPKVMDIYAAKRPGTSTVTPDAVPHRPLNPIESWIQFAVVVEERQYVFKSVLIIYHGVNSYTHRLDIRMRARRLINHDRLAERNKLIKLRETLKALMAQLSILQNDAGVLPTASKGNEIPEQLFIDWEDEEDILAPGSGSAVYEPIDLQTIFLPSNGNVDIIHAPSEIHARISQARGHLNQIRELIAERSFQYSDVIRKGPRKGVRTRGQAAAKELRERISHHAQAYSRCRDCLVQLGADNNILREFRVLTKDDVRSSTAVLNPNIPGSTNFRLSWIWYSVNQRLGPRWVLDPDAPDNADPNSLGDNADPATVLEFKRVHWLRARAHFQRWKEESTLVRYEMQWTVTYFLHKSATWKSAIKDNPTILPGAIAYAHRKAQMWHHLALISDRSFRSVNKHYKPL
ncbi:hypothetical protein JR316_0002983 [Psilocybe cubensis]|uniref:Uncharacterized protein n=1 Tax=Psilocybe cubensis TaxID=181762 RepID=A0ACB8H8N0_PSICU|nr:hypothetical protein JR316_0002983 [Psilocybe cubensis]KAH9483515.1 hypothetical protein JR316_0002983 [Psilocybe cubensis]